jgi:hypothetical protein
MTDTIKERVSSSTGSPLIRPVSEIRRGDPHEANVLGTLLSLRKRILSPPEVLVARTPKTSVPEVFAAKTRKTRTTRLRSKIHPPALLVKG